MRQVFARAYRFNLTPTLSETENRALVASCEALTCAILVLGEPSAKDLND